MIRVLIADDQAIVRTGLSTMLAAEPDLNVVGEVEDGDQVGTAVADLNPDVVLMDIRMPRMDGITATAELVSTGSSAKVCVLTTYGLGEYVFDALEAGAAGFLLKTDSPERIVSTIRAVAAGDFALGADATALVTQHFLRRARPGADDPLDVLTPRERDVFTLIAEGYSNAEISQRLYVTEGTTKTHVARILHKLGLRDRVQVALFAYRNGLV